ncbi:TIGR00725 family protein [bacterium]|nr:MAG: TIGR00725 family protein [bacterium]
MEISKLRQKKIISVIGGSKPNQNALDNAFRVGELIARNDMILVCGGLTGVMEYACKGAKSKGGLTIGILPMETRDSANPYVDIAIPTGLGIARNLLVVRTGDIVIAIDGSWGTLSEIALAKNIGRTVIALESFHIDGIIPADSPEQAIKLALANM